MTPKDPLLGREIGSYQLTDVLGRGGMGKVYLALHPQIGKRVAVKILKPEFTEQESVVQRFFHEAKAVNEIRHPNVIDITDFGRMPDGPYYILMEYLDGESLSDTLTCGGPLPATRLGHIGLQLCAALDAAHRRGIIHRDLKTDNIFLVEHQNQEDFVKVLDFGIAKLLYQDQKGNPSTEHGSVLGTPLYMAPEQAMGQIVDQQSDVYSLGVILYQMATNTLPFYDPNPIAVANMQVNAPLPPPRERCPAINPQVETVIVGCLEKERAKRYVSMMDVAIDLGLACGIDPLPYFDREVQQWLRPLVESKITQSYPELPALQTMKNGPQTLIESYPSLRAITVPQLPASTGSPGRGRRYSLLAAVGLLGAAALYVGVLRPTTPEGSPPSAAVSPLKVRTSTPLPLPAAHASPGGSPASLDSSPASAPQSSPTATAPADPEPSHATPQSAPSKPAKTPSRGNRPSKKKKKSSPPPKKNPSVDLKRHTLDPFKPE